MDTEATTYTTDSNKEIEKVGTVGDQLRELIDDHQQMGHGLHFGVHGPPGLILFDIVEIASFVEHALATLLLSQQRGIGAINQRGVALQVGNDACYVW